MTCTWIRNVFFKKGISSFNFKSLSFCLWEDGWKLGVILCSKLRNFCTQIHRHRQWVLLNVPVCGLYLLVSKPQKLGVLLFLKNILPWTLVVYFIYGFSSFEIILPKLLPKAQWGLKIEDSAINRFVCIIIDFLWGNDWDIFITQ